MKTFFLTFYCFLFCYFIASAQQTTFKVVAIKGKVSTNRQPITQNTDLLSNQSIVLENDSSYVCFVVNDTKGIIELNKKGFYKMTDLQKQAQLAENNYAKFVLEELFSPPTKKSMYQHINRTGSVKKCVFSPIVTILPSGKSDIYGDKITIKWFLRSGVSAEYTTSIEQYKVEIYSLNDVLLFEEKTQKTQLFIDLSNKQELLQEKILVLKVMSLDNSGKNLESSTVDGDAIVRLPEAQRQEITQELNAIFKDQNSNTAFAKLIEARFFEDKELYIDAINAYEEMLKLSFGAEAYQKVYQNFLSRNGLIATNE